MDFETFISQISMLLYQKLEANAERVKRIVANLEVDAEEYKRLLVDEVVNGVFIEAQFVFSPHSRRTPEDIKGEALSLLDRKLERDERLYARG